jgi:hypothetical protein
LPAGDVYQPDIPDSPARVLCRQIMEAAGQDAQSSADLLAQYNMCAAFFFLRDGLNGAPSVNAAGFQAAVEALGAHPASSASTFGDSYAPGKHWGAGQYAPAQYQSVCSCYRYSGPPRPL